MLRIPVLIGAAAMAACAPGAPPPEQVPGPSPLALGDITTEADGRCYARTAPPTQTIVVNELVEVVPEVRDRNNVVTQEAVFRSVTRPQTSAAGEGERFETVCPPDYTPQMVATLQRALTVRQLYSGPISGVYDGPTSGAVQLLQEGQGVASPLLSVAAARSLGVVTVSRER